MARFVSKQAHHRYCIDQCGQINGPLTLHIETHYVYDEVMQIEVFHWSGSTAKAKADAVAAALESLGHAKD